MWMIQNLRGDDPAPPTEAKGVHVPTSREARPASSHRVLWPHTASEKEPKAGSLAPCEELAQHSRPWLFSKAASKPAVAALRACKQLLRPRV